MANVAAPSACSQRRIQDALVASVVDGSVVVMVGCNVVVVIVGASWALRWRRRHLVMKATIHSLDG